MYSPRQAHAFEFPGLFPPMRHMGEITTDSKVVLALGCTGSAATTGADAQRAKGRAGMFLVMAWAALAPCFT